MEKQAITLLQRVVIKSVVYEYGHRFEYSKKRLAWLRKHKINHRVTGE